MADERAPVLPAGTRVRTHAVYFGKSYAKDIAKASHTYKKFWWKAFVDGKVVSAAREHEDWQSQTYNILYDDADDDKDTYESSRRHFAVISEDGEVLEPADEPVPAVEKAAVLAARTAHEGP